MTKTVLILNGPGLADPSDADELGTSGKNSLQGIHNDCASLCERLDLSLDFRQTEDPNELLSWIKQDSEQFDALIINPVGRMRSSSAAAELYRKANRAIADTSKPVVEVRMANVYRQPAGGAEPLHEPGRDMGFVCGFGRQAYRLALEATRNRLGRPNGVASGAKSASVSRIVHVINGPNLNLLGTREPEIYGRDTLDDIASRCRAVGAGCGISIVFLQSNHEGGIVDWIQDAIGKADAIVINAAAYTHTSVAIHDALRAFRGYKVELHISNPHAREPFRHVSYVSSAVDAVVEGLGVAGYGLVVSLLGDILGNPA